jgi:hypothetical protein
MGPSGGYVSNYVFYWTGTGWVHQSNQVGTGGTRPALTANTPATTTSGYNFANFHDDMSSYRTVYKSSTFYLNATAFNNQGTVTTAKFKPDVILGQTGYLRERMDEKSRRNFNMRLKALLADSPQLAELEDEFEVLDSKGKPLPKNEEAFWQKFEAATHNYDIQMVDFGQVGSAVFDTVLNPGSPTIFAGGLPQSPAAVLVSSPKGAMREARDGAFVVSQPVDPVQMWTTLDPPGANSVLASPDNLTYSVMRIRTSGGFYDYVFLNNGSAPFNPSGSTVPAGDLTWNNLDWHFTMFDGLSQPTFNTEGIPINAPYITDKTYVGIEGNARPEGSLTSFQKLLPLPDPEALQMAVGIFHARPDSLPAAANDFGALASVAAKFLPTAITWLKGIFGKKSPAQPVARPRLRTQTQPIRTTQLVSNVQNLVRDVNNKLNQINRPAAEPRPYTNSTAFGNINQLTRGMRGMQLQRISRNQRRSQLTRAQPILAYEPVPFTAAQAPRPQRARRAQVTQRLPPQFRQNPRRNY